MRNDQEFKTVEKFLLDHTPSVEVMRAFNAIRKKLETYDTVVQQYASREKQIRDLLASNVALSLTKLGGK